MPATWPLGLNPPEYVGLGVGAGRDCGVDGAGHRQIPVCAQRDGGQGRECAFCHSRDHGRGSSGGGVVFQLREVFAQALV